MLYIMFYLFIYLFFILLALLRANIVTDDGLFYFEETQQQKNESLMNERDFVVQQLIHSLS